MARLSEKDIVSRVAIKLTQFGCPGVRAAEGTPEWERMRGAYAKSPDLIAGPIIGNGAPEDFLIDVFSPTGEQFVEPRAGSPLAAAKLRSMLEQQGTFSVRELGREYEPFFGPINKKLAKYSGARGGSPMVGLAMYFFLADNAFLGPIIALVHALAALDDAFGITSADNVEEMKDALNSMLSKGSSLVMVVLPLKVQLAFLMVHADRTVDGNVDEKTLLLINSGVVHDGFAWGKHPVVQWLRALATEPLPDRPT